MKKKDWKDPRTFLGSPPLLSSQSSFRCPCLGRIY